MLKVEFTRKNQEVSFTFTEGDRWFFGRTFDKDTIEANAHLPIGYEVGTVTYDEFGNKYKVIEV